MIESMIAESLFSLHLAILVVPSIILISFLIPEIIGAYEWLIKFLKKKK